MNRRSQNRRPKHYNHQRNSSGVDEEPDDRYALDLGVWELDSAVVEREHAMEGLDEELDLLRIVRTY